MAIRGILAVVLAAFAIVAATPDASLAQATRFIPDSKKKPEGSGGGNLTKAELDAMIEAARKKGVQIIVVTPKPKAAPKAAASGTFRFAGMMVRIENELETLAAHLPNIRAALASAIHKSSPDGSASHFLWVALIVIGLMLVAGFVERAYGQWIKKKMKAVWPEPPPHMPGKMSFLITRFLLRCVGFVIFGLVVVVLAAPILEDHKPTNQTALMLLLVVLLVKTVVEFWRVWLSPGLAEFRLPALDDAKANRLFGWLFWVHAVTGVFFAFYLWLQVIGVDRVSQMLIYMTLSLITLLLLLALMVKNRRIVAELLGLGTPKRLHNFAAGNWHILLGIYFVIAWVLSMGQFLLGKPIPLGPTTGMMATLMAALTLFAIGVVALDWFFYRRKGAPNRIAAEAAAEAGTEPLSDADKAEPIFADDEEARQRFFGGIHSFEGLAKQTLRWAIILFVIGGLLMTWGVNVTDPEAPLVKLADVIFVIFAGYIAYQSVRIVIAQKIEQEGGFDEPEPGEEGGAIGVSRLATLLPLFRNFILATIVVIAGMIGLSELGIDVAPLFAGAGVIGLAIGFGAQTLIRDIFSGAFFLVDDAFRKGEYIDVGDVMGTVERISVRSMQVRHHNGPLHTIPFGEIKYLTNFSRDWVMMKLSLRLTYDTDIEKVRKLIKNLGQQLLEDPVIGDKFLEPLKSQGVLAMEESAMIVRVKFMCKPGEQFVMRRQVYAAIQELFAKEGIKFAHREVTVHVADDENPKTTRRAPARKRAAAAAAAAIAAEEGAKKPAGGDQR